MHNTFFITRASRILFFALSFLATGLFASSASEQSSVTAHITVSVTIGEPPTLPDFQTWFEDFFTETPPNHTVNSTSDYDGDGQFDYLEYYAGTDPTDGASQLKMVSPTLSDENAIVSWDSSDSNVPESRVYHLFRSGPDALGILANSSATISSLENEASITDLGEVASQGTITSYTDVGVKSQFPLFYRVFLSKPEPQAPTP